MSEGTGRKEDMGSGDGEGTNINIPLPPGSGHRAALKAFDEIVIPAAERFRPDMIIVSAGYDAHLLDPLASLQFTSSTYHSLCQRLRQLSHHLCRGRLVFLLEGGYHLRALGESVTDSFLGLIDAPSIDSIHSDALQDEPHEEVNSLIKQVALLHQISWGRE